MKHAKESRFRYVEIHGTPRERGQIYGAEARDLIKKTLEIYKGVFQDKGVDWYRACQIARDHWRHIELLDASFSEEIRGIAEGADLPVEEIVAINARTEIMYGLEESLTPEENMDGCTGAIVDGAASLSGHTLHGQNWDWLDECAECAIVLKIVPENGPKILTFVEAGLLARCGLNSCGIGLTGNFLQSDRDLGRSGYPLVILRRQILMSNTIAEAMDAVYQSKRAFSNNIMISHSGGFSINLETTPDEIFWMRQEDGLLVHSNHFVTDAARAKVKDMALLAHSDSLYRNERVYAYLSGHRGEITPDHLKQVFADKYGAPYSVCREPNEGPGGKTSSTVATIIMDTTDKVMWVAERPYKNSRFEEFRLE